jgi:acetolactate synthase small subunit
MRHVLSVLVENEPGALSRIVGLFSAFRGRIIDVTERTYTIELTGNTSKIEAFIRAVDRAAILETVRTGSSGIGRGERILRV